MATLAKKEGFLKSLVTAKRFDLEFRFNREDWVFASPGFRFRCFRSILCMLVFCEFLVYLFYCLV